MFKPKHKSTTLFLLIFSIAISLLILMQLNNRTGDRVSLAALPVPTAVYFGSVQVTTMDSPDGTKTLTMKKQPINDLVKYSFFTSDKADTALQLIFSKEENISQTLSIPYNSWSPDNVYFFLKETTATESNYYIFYTSGKAFPDNSQYINIRDLFTQKLPDYILEDVTGWADPKLLIVNTKKAEDKNKYSFWFDVPSQLFIQLGTYFN